MTADELRSRVTSRILGKILDFLIDADRSVPSHILHIAIYGPNHHGGQVKQCIQRLRAVIRPLGWDIPAENHGLAFKGYRLVKIDEAASEES